MLEAAFTRRGLLAGGGIGMAAGLTRQAEAAAPATRTVSAAQFGTVGDGRADDTAALQKALDAAFSGADAGLVIIPPGTYRIRRTLRINFPTHMGHRSGIVAHGARLISEIDAGNVLEVSSQGYARYFMIEGLDIQGSGREGNGIVFAVEDKEHSLYNFCLRDVIVQGCGGDGCSMSGNVFEGQIINSYFRRNGGNGATFAHGKRAGILSCIHVFGCIFGDNGHYGAALVNRAVDVAFYGCYFLLNGSFGLVAETGISLLSDCGVENNHTKARRFEEGDAGMLIQNHGTMVGCGGYSMFNQTHLVRAYVAGQFAMVGCWGSGDARAAKAGLAKLSGARDTASATLLSCRGRVDYADGFEALEIGNGGGIKFGADWRSRHLPQLGDYRLWVDQRGRLRLKRGKPGSDEDGTVVGA